MFPDASADALTAVLELSGGDVNAATDYLLSNEGALEEVENGVRGEVPAPPVPPVPAADAGAHQAAGDDDEGDEEEEEHEEEERAAPKAKRQCVEATQAEKRAGCVLVKFDDRAFWKTYLELLNLGLSKLNHSSVTLWSADVPDERAALAMLESPGGYWVHYFPVSEIDYVWRLVVNSHLQSKAFGGVVSLKAHSFESQSGGEVEIRALVRDPRELVELKRVGTGVLSVAPGRGDTKTAIFFVSEKMALKAEKAAQESKSRLVEKSTCSWVRKGKAACPCLKERAWSARLLRSRQVRPPSPLATPPGTSCRRKSRRRPRRRRAAPSTPRSSATSRSSTRWRRVARSPGSRWTRSGGTPRIAATAAQPRSIRRTNGQNVFIARVAADGRFVKRTGVVEVLLCTHVGDRMPGFRSRIPRALPPPHTPGQAYVSTDTSLVPHRARSAHPGKR